MTASVITKGRELAIPETVKMTHRELVPVTYPHQTDVMRGIKNDTKMIIPAGIQERAIPQESLGHLLQIY